MSLKSPIWLVIVFFNYSYSQTCIIPIRTATEIYIAADIREDAIITTVDPITHKSSLDTSFLTVCKIHKIGKFRVFCYSGIALPELNSAALEYSKRYKKLKDLTFYFSKKTKNILSKFLDDGLKMNKKIYESRFSHLINGCEFLFAGFENGMPKMYIFLVKIKSKIYEPLVFDSLSHKDYDQPITINGIMNYMPMGEVDAIWPIKKIGTFDISNPVFNFNTLMKMQHNLTPLYVSDTCDIIKINSTGIHWMQKTGQCPN